MKPLPWLAVIAAIATAFLASPSHAALKVGARIATQYDALLMQKPVWSDRTSYVISPNGKIVHVYSEPKPRA